MVHSSSHMIKNDFFVKLYKALSLLAVTCINAKHYLHLNQVFKNNHSNPETRFNAIPKPNMMMSLFHNINNGANQDTVYTRVCDYVSPSVLLPALSLNSNLVDNSLVILDVSKQVQEDPKSLMAMIGGEVPYHFKTMFSVGNLFHTVDSGKEWWEKNCGNYPGHQLIHSDAPQPSLGLHKDCRRHDSTSIGRRNLEK